MISAIIQVFIKYKIYKFLYKVSSMFLQFYQLSFTICKKLLFCKATKVSSIEVSATEMRMVDRSGQNGCSQWLEDIIHMFWYILQSITSTNIYDNQDYIQLLLDYYWITNWQFMSSTQVLMYLKIEKVFFMISAQNILLWNSG